MSTGFIEQLLRPFQIRTPVSPNNFKVMKQKIIPLPFVTLTTNQKNRSITSAQSISNSMTTNKMNRDTTVLGSRANSMEKNMKGLAPDSSMAERVPTEVNKMSEPMT